MLHGDTTTAVHPLVPLLRPRPRSPLQARGAAEGLPKDAPAPLRLVADPSACPPPLRRVSAALREQTPSRELQVGGMSACCRDRSTPGKSYVCRFDPSYPEGGDTHAAIGPRLEHLLTIGHVLLLVVGISE